MPAKDLSLPTPEALQESVGGMIAQAAAFEVSTPEDSAIAQQRRAQINARMKELVEQRMELTRPLDESKKKIMELFAVPVEHLKAALDDYGNKVLNFNRTQERIRAEAQRKADADAEAQRRKLLEQAQRAAEKGRDNKAEMLTERAAATVAPIVRTEAPKVAGTQFRKIAKFRIRDGSKITAAFLMPDEKKIGAVVRSMGKDAEGLVGEGLEVWIEDIIASGKG